jgi:hypothetical protein
MTTVEKKFKPQLVTAQHYIVGKIADGTEIKNFNVWKTFFAG